MSCPNYQHVRLALDTSELVAQHLWLEHCCRSVELAMQVPNNLLEGISSARHGARIRAPYAARVVLARAPRTPYALRPRT